MTSTGRDVMATAVSVDHITRPHTRPHTSTPYIQRTRLVYGCHSVLRVSKQSNCRVNFSLFPLPSWDLLLVSPDTYSTIYIHRSIYITCDTSSSCVLVGSSLTVKLCDWAAQSSCWSQTWLDCLHRDGLICVGMSGQDLHARACIVDITQ